MCDKVCIRIGNKYRQRIIGCWIIWTKREQEAMNTLKLARLLITNSQETLYLSMTGGLWDTIHPGVCKGSVKLARQQ